MAEEAASDPIDICPSSSHDVVACLMCSLLKTRDQFYDDGCDNCEEFLHIQNNRDNLHDFTTANYYGVVSLMQPKESWVAKWQRIATFKPGCYALRVVGKVSSQVLADFAVPEEQMMRYRGEVAFNASS
eukprot:m.41856 g.41856  ORF g.41856 m.41856 type:complete len:129 (+) comp10619_c0_seq3:43-429(+)